MPENQTTKEEKIYNLVIELEKAKALKKSVVQGHNEEIKRIQGEIKDLLKENEELE